MGNKRARARALSRPKDRGQEAVCDRFDIAATCRHSILEVRLVTDLPAGTPVAIAVTRLFPEGDGHDWAWSALDRTLPVAPLAEGMNGFVLERSCDRLDGDGMIACCGLRRAMAARIAGPPSTDAIIIVSAPTHYFGFGNRKLSSAAVSVERSGHGITRGLSLRMPLSPAAMAKIGVRYAASAEAPETQGVPVTVEEALIARAATLRPQRV